MQDWLDQPLEGMGPLFQALIKRATRRQPLPTTVLEVSRYATKSKLVEPWEKFIRECPNIPEEVLMALCDSRDQWIWIFRWNVAYRKQDLPESVLMVLSQENRTDVRKLVASRTQDLPYSVLKKLSQDKSWYVRNTIAKRKQTLPEDILVTLAQDEDWVIRDAITTRNDLPEHILKYLSQDEDE